MKKNVIKKGILIIAILCVIVLNVNTEVFGWSEVITSAQDFLEAADSSKVTVSATAIQNTSSFLYNILLAAGVVIAVIVAIILGIQLMLGGAEGQAKAKEMLLPFVVGCVVVFGGLIIWKLAVSMGTKFEDASSYVYEIEEQIEIAMK